VFADDFIPKNEIEPPAELYVIRLGMRIVCNSVLFDEVFSYLARCMGIIICIRVSSIVQLAQSHGCVASLLEQISDTPSSKAQPRMLFIIAWMRYLLILQIALQLTMATATVLYDDGQPHSITQSINDAIQIRSSSTLKISSYYERYTIHSPKGIECAVRLYMSSTLNMTGGEIVGADSSSDENTSSDAGAGVIVGSASRAEFYKDATVRGGNHLGELDTVRIRRDTDAVGITPQVKTLESSDTTTSTNSVKGGDALISQYFGSIITIHGGNFIGGRGTSSSDGNSVHVAYDAQAHIYGGSFQGDWLARDRGVVVAYGCVQRIGTRLVGHLENGDQVNVQVVEQGGGQVIVKEGEGNCDMYRRQSSSAAVGRLIASALIRMAVAVLLCFRMM
jgi:hypothetical protein